LKEELAGAESSVREIRDIQKQAGELRVNLDALTGDNGSVRQLEDRAKSIRTTVEELVNSIADVDDRQSELTKAQDGTIARVAEMKDSAGELGQELQSWDLDRYTYHGETSFEHAMNWKLAIDTFGETYHFNTLHRDTLAHDFYGNVQMYDRFERNHRMMLCLKNIDNLREQQPDDWNVLLAALPVYYLFPNIQLIIGYNGPTLVRVYPDADNPNHSRSRISFYLDPAVTEMQGRNREIDPLDIAQRMHGFADVIRDEDYVAAASSHIGAQSGAIDYVTFGRNEPALHHYHNTYREALGMPPLERISN